MLIFPCLLCRSHLLESQCGGEMFGGRSSDQPVVWALMDFYTLVLSHQFDLIDYGCETLGVDHTVVL